MASEDDEPTPRRHMTTCEVLEWFFGKSRFARDARPDRCAECIADAAGPMAERYRHHMGDSGAICGHESRATDKYSRDAETRR